MDHVARMSDRRKGEVYTVTSHEDTEWGVEEQLYFFFNIGMRFGWMVNVTLRPLYP
jgi:hypothetical protein